MYLCMTVAVTSMHAAYALVTAIVFSLTCSLKVIPSPEFLSHSLLRQVLAADSLSLEVLLPPGSSRVTLLSCTVYD